MRIDELEKLLNEVKGVLRSKAVLNTQRLMILIALYLSGRLLFTDLARVTGIGKGRLEYHLDVLEKEGLIRRRRYLTLLGPRVYIEITKEGEGLLKEVINALSKVVKRD